MIFINILRKNGVPSTTNYQTSKSGQKPVLRRIMMRVEHSAQIVKFKCYYSDGYILVKGTICNIMKILAYLVSGFNATPWNLHVTLSFENQNLKNLIENPIYMKFLNVSTIDLILLKAICFKMSNF